MTPAPRRDRYESGGGTRPLADMRARVLALRRADPELTPPVIAAWFRVSVSAVRNWIRKAGL